MKDLAKGFVAAIFISAVFALVAFAVSPIHAAQPQKVGNMSDLGDRLISFQSGQMTDPSDIEKLRKDLNIVGSTVDVTRGWIGSGGILSVNQMEAQNGLFGVVPNESTYVTFGGTIPNNDGTYIATITNFAPSKTKYFEVDLTNKWLNVQVQSSRLTIVYGTFIFPSNATGTRRLSTQSYDVTDTPIGGSGLVIFQQPGWAGDYNYITFATNIGLSPQVHHIKFFLFQDSGAPMTLTSGKIILGIMR
jgi:hypothetical protein